MYEDDGREKYGMDGGFDDIIVLLFWFVLEFFVFGFCYMVL